jgi:hypothetical protein
VYQKVTGVVFADGNDRSEAINMASQRYDLPPLILVGGAQMETGLGANRERWGVWPDISFGDWQQTVKYAPYGDHSASDENIADVRDKFLNDWEYSLEVAAKQYASYWHTYQNALETFSRYNGGPGMAFENNPNQNHILESWLSVQHYTSDEGNGGVIEDGWNPIDVRDEFPYKEGNGEFPERDPATIDKVLYHHGASRMPDDTQEDEMALLHEYWELHTGNDPAHGWPSIGYHLAIGRSDRCYFLNGLQLISYHAGDWNANVTGVGIVFLGNFEHEVPPPEMLQTAVKARLWVAQRTGRDDLPYFGHKEFTTTGCPGEWWPAQRGLLANLDDNWVPPEDGNAGGLTYADLVNWMGYSTGDLAEGFQKDHDEIERASQSEKVKEVLQFGLQPRINTLKRGGA